MLLIKALLTLPVIGAVLAIPHNNEKRQDNGVIAARACSANNLLRLLRRYSAEASPFCSSFLAGGAAATVTTTVPLATAIADVIVVVTNTKTVTATITEAAVLNRRQAVSSLAFLGTYTADPRLSSECACFLGTNIPANRTATVTVTVEPTVLSFTATLQTTEIVTEFTTITGSPTTTSTPTSSCGTTIVLASPTPLVGDIVSAPFNIDDTFYPITLPFPVQIYDQSATTIYVSTNGIISLGFGSSSYTEEPLPASSQPPNAVFPFWDDTYIFAGVPQGIFYLVDSGKLTIEYYLSHYVAPSEYYHYIVQYNSAQPGKWQFTYYEVSDKGNSSGVGAQGGGQFVQYSFRQPVINNGLNLLLDTNTNTISESNICF